MVSNNLQPDTIEVSNDMLKAVRAARTKYAIHMEEQKKEKNNNIKETQKDILKAEIKDLQSKICKKSQTCKVLDEKFVKLVAEAEKKKDFNLITEANALKRKSEGTEEEKKTLEEALKVVEEKKKKI